VFRDFVLIIFAVLVGTVEEEGLLRLSFCAANY
jgi:hypothetical protein